MIFQYFKKKYVVVEVHAAYATAVIPKIAEKWKTNEVPIQFFEDNSPSHVGEKVIDI